MMVMPGKSPLPGPELGPDPVPGASPFPVAEPFFPAPAGFKPPLPLFSGAFDKPEPDPGFSPACFSSPAAPPLPAPGRTEIFPVASAVPPAVLEVPLPLVTEEPDPSEASGFSNGFFVGSTTKLPAISASGILTGVSGTLTALMTRAVLVPTVASGSGAGAGGLTSGSLDDGSASAPAVCGGDAGAGSAGWSTSLLASTGTSGTGVSAFFFCGTGAMKVGIAAETTMLCSRMANFNFGAFTRSGRRMV